MPRLGVLGTLVLDTIHLRGPHDGAPVEPLTDWGGIAYSLSTLEAAAPEGWDVFPFVKVGSDLRASADSYFGGLERVVSWEGVVTVPEPTNRVDLYYGAGPRRCEKLSGGVPGWSWAELEPLVSSCEALIVNFIAGWELDLDAAQQLREAYPGQLYADIHSLLLAVSDHGVRVLKSLPDWDRWRSCFDVLQMNDEELGALAGAGGREEEVAHEAVLHGPRALFITRGAKGASWYERVAGQTESVREGHESADPVPAEVADPTGCGDVWGAACAAALLEGLDPAAAARRGNHLAGVAARHRGTRGLAGALRHAGHAGEPA